MHIFSENARNKKYWHGRPPKPTIRMIVNRLEKTGPVKSSTQHHMIVQLVLGYTHHFTPDFTHWFEISPIQIQTLELKPADHQQRFSTKCSLWWGTFSPHLHGYANICRFWGPENQFYERSLHKKVLVGAVYELVVSLGHSFVKIPRKILLLTMANVIVTDFCETSAFVG